jgi:DNA-binding transcriptional LysR family regulator
MELRKKHPGIRLQIYEGSAGQIDQWLSNGFIDIGLPYRYGETFPPNVDPLLKVSSYLVGAPGTPLTESATLRFAMLDKCPLVLPGTPSNVRLALDQIAKQVGVRFDVVLQADSTQIQKAVAQLGDVYAVLPAHAVAEEVEAGTLRISRIVDPDFPRTVVLATTPAKPPSRATREVARNIRAIIGNKRENWERIGSQTGPANGISGT